MPFSEIHTWILKGGGILFLLFTLVQIAPIKINPWSWIARSIGNAINKSILDKMNTLETKLTEVEDKVKNLDSNISKIDSSLKSLEDKVKDLSKELSALDKNVCELEDNCEERNIILCRSRMLRFGDEILHGIKHSKDHFDQILLDCTKYENYCKEHTGFLNNITEQTINLILHTYQTCMEENSFL